jgi:hypothetical protein
MKIFDLITKAFKKKDSTLVEVKTDSELYSLVSSKMNSVDIQRIDKLETRVANIEKLLNYSSTRINTLIENQKTLNDLIVNVATMIEEVYYALNPIENVGTQQERKEQSSDFTSSVKTSQKKEEIN